MASGSMPPGPGLFLLLVPRKARCTRCSSMSWWAVPGGRFLAFVSLVMGGRRERDIHQYPRPVSVAVCCRSLVQDGGDSCQSLWFGISGNGPHAASLGSVKEFLPAVPCFLMAPFSAPFSSFASPWLAVPLLLFLLTRPRSLFLSYISWFHRLFNLAHMVVTRTCSFRMPVRVAMIHSISSSSSFSLQLSDRMGRAPDLACQIFSSLGSVHSPFSFSSLSLKAHFLIFQVKTTLAVTPARFHFIISWSDVEVWFPMSLIIQSL